MREIEKRLLARIVYRLQAEADEVFDPEEDLDSDGYDQYEREGILRALDMVREEFERETSI